MIKPYLDQWMKVEGNIRDVSDKIYPNQITVHIYENESSLYLRFEANTWGAQVGSFDVGDQISAIGKIELIDRLGYISLKECELVT